MKRSVLISLVLAVSLLCHSFLPCVAVCAEERSDINSACALTANYIKAAVPNPQFGSVGGDWSVFSLTRAGAVDDAYIAGYYSGLEKYVSERNGVLTRSKYTEYARAVLALGAIGADARSVGGYDLLMPLTDYDSVARQGVNGAAFALLALDFYGEPICGGYESEYALRTKYITYLLDRQHSDGGFGLGDESDVDVTAMAICALSRYLTYDGVRKSDAVGRALGYLSLAQGADGSFLSGGEANAESAAQVVSALCMLGIDPAGDERFIKNKVNPVQALLSYQNSNGSFSHTAGGEENLMATEQAFCALAAYKRFVIGECGLYCRYESGVFADTNEHWARESVAAMSSAGIMESDFGVFFNPDRAMVRGEFAKAVVTAQEAEMSAEGETGIKFDDVSADDDFYRHVIAAANRGWIFGVDDTHFEPYKSITRAETAVIIYRVLGGGETISTDFIKGYADFYECPEWSTQALAYCVNSGVLVGSDNRLLPDENVTKAQMAAILTRIMKQKATLR